MLPATVSERARAALPVPRLQAVLLAPDLPLRLPRPSPRLQRAAARALAQRGRPAPGRSPATPRRALRARQAAQDGADIPAPAPQPVPAAHGRTDLRARRGGDLRERFDPTADDARGDREGALVRRRHDRRFDPSPGTTGDETQAAAGEGRARA